MPKTSTVLLVVQYLTQHLLIMMELKEVGIIITAIFLISLVVIGQKIIGNYLLGGHILEGSHTPQLI